MAIAYEPKLAGLTRRFGQVSVPAHTSSMVLAAAVHQALEMEPPTAAAVEQEVKSARHALSLMHLVIDGGQLTDPGRLAGLPLSSGSGSW